MLNHPHEVTPELDVDWTLCPHDWLLELRLREVRNRLIKEELLKHKPVIYRSSGGPLYPRVSSGDQCTFHPVTHASEVAENDIVCCEVQPGDRFYCHRVKTKEWRCGPPPPHIGLGDGAGYYFVISNMHGWENGWCAWRHIYGKLADVRR